MSRPVWQGVISFGLVSVPVSLYAAEVSTDLRFNLIDSRDKARIRYERVNEATGEEVPWSAIVKGYEYGDGNYVLLRDEDFRRAAVAATKTIGIEDFVSEEDVGTVFFDKPYFLVPGKGGDKGYALLREAMKQAGKIGVAKVVIRSRQHLAALVPWNTMLVLNLMRFSQELQDPADFKVPGKDLRALKISTKEVDLAKQLIESMKAEWKPARYKDDYRTALLAWIRKKVKAGKLDKPLAAEEPEEDERTAEVVDVMALLQQSIKGSAHREGKTKAATGKAKKARIVSVGGGRPKRAKAPAKPVKTTRKQAAHGS